MQVHAHHISKWVAMAELYSIPNVICQYWGLLLHAGIASVSKLAQTPVHHNRGFVRGKLEAIVVHA
ncbi:DUF4332 domain-containing protein [Microseira sp. BLCC-F43]|uniref:DUF4332 domain-containing protein n=1 Tax=Microseira sp. BLCC-F43 TaxID=3153602 RepID=UPI0035B93BAA